MIALICLLLISALAVSLTRTVILQREQVLRSEWALQAEWLADAALQRGVRQLRADGEYSGEEWRPDDSRGETIGVSEIRIADGNAEQTAELTVVVHVPAASTDRVQIERTVVVSIRDVE